MMKPNKKAKWIVGITGTALSAFILSQLDANPASTNQADQPVVSQNEAAVENSNGGSDEQELANKDWSNFTVESNSESQTIATGCSNSYRTNYYSASCPATSYSTN